MQKLLLVLCAFGIFLCCGGCRTFAALASPTPYEMKVPAEYKLSDNKPQRMLVLVEQPAWATSGANMRLYLTEAVTKLLVDKADLKADTIVPYQELMDMRNKTADYSMMSPVQIGKAMNAQMVLYVAIDNFELYGLSEAGYYRGQLDTRSGLYDAVGGKKLWPESSELKVCSVNFEVQKGQPEAARRLASATARCIVRNLYNCSKKEYKVADESVKDDLKSW